MREFWTLLKYEFKMQIPLFRKKGKKDVLGGIFITLIVGLLVFASVIFLSRILKNYLLVETNKVHEPLVRAKEILSLLYLLIFVAITALSLERTRKVFDDDKNRLIFLRLPLNKRKMFLSKFAILLLHAYVTSFVFILTINCILASLIEVGAYFWFTTLVICLVMPIICILFVALLIVPYIKVIELLRSRYFLLFAFFTIVTIGAFIAYSLLLEVFQTLLTTGSIRFLFDENFVGAMQGIYKYAYPTSALVAILFKDGLLKAYLILFAFVIFSMLVVFLISKNLYAQTLYRNHKSRIKTKKPKKTKQMLPVFSMLKKEFICVCRDPKYIFSYFSVTMSTPFMVYCCFSLLQTLLFNTLGIHINFALALSVVLLFGVLTNTFCSTNITRDGRAILKMKTLPISVSKIFWSKVLFCGIVNSFAVIVSCLLLAFTSSLSFLDALVCIVIGLPFTFAQIFTATRLDLNHAKISLSDIELNEQSSKTLSKVVLLGGVLTLIGCATSVFFALFASGIEILNSAILLKVFMYLIPTLIGTVYLTLSFIYFRSNINKSFDKLS